MKIIDRLARVSAGTLAWVIAVSSLLAVVAIVLSVRTATTQASVARTQADQAIAEARASAEASSSRLTQAVCAIADAQPLHLEDPNEAPPTTKRGVQSARAWQVLYDAQHCTQIAVPPTGSPLPTGAPSASSVPVPTHAPTTEGPSALGGTS